MRNRTGSLVILNDGPWGTMCARVGCTPSKALVNRARLHRLHFPEFGLLASEKLTVDGRAVIARVRKARDALVAKTCAAMAHLAHLLTLATAANFTVKQTLAMPSITRISKTG